MKGTLFILFYTSFIFAQDITVRFNFSVNELNDIGSTTKKFTLKQNDINSIFELDDVNDENQFKNSSKIRLTKYHESDTIKSYLIGENAIAFLWKEKNFKNFKEDFQIHNYMQGKKFIYVKDKITLFDWDIVEKSDTLIANYHCEKATTKFRGRNYIAYFTNEISNQGGPYKFDGLPGFIIKIKSTDGYVDIEAREIIVTKNKIKNIFNPFKGKEIIFFNELKNKRIEFEKESFERAKLESKGDGRMTSVTYKDSEGIEDIGLKSPRVYK